MEEIYNMFNFLQAIFHKVAVIFTASIIAVTGLFMPTQKVVPPAATLLVQQETINQNILITPTSTEQIESQKNQSETDKRLMQLENELKKEKEKRLELEKNKSAINKEPINSANNLLIQPSNTILCNGKYWTQCPAGQTFSCPAQGNATCSLPSTTTQGGATQEQIDKFVKMTKELLDGAKRKQQEQSISSYDCTDTTDLKGLSPQDLISTLARRCGNTSYYSFPPSTYVPPISNSIDKYWEEKERNNLDRTLCERTGGTFSLGQCFDF